MAANNGHASGKQLGKGKPELSSAGNERRSAGYLRVQCNPIRALEYRKAKAGLRG